VDPSFSKTYYFMAQLKLKQGYYNDAITEFDKALKYGGDDLKILSGRAKAYFELGDLNNACSDWTTMNEKNSRLAREQINTYCR
jgi:tetratricopeptide (TPR) repeat protein